MTLNELIEALTAFKSEGEEKGELKVKVMIPGGGWEYIKNIGEYSGEIYLGIPDGLK